MLYFIFVSSKISRICNSKIVSSPGERERERDGEREDAFSSHYWTVLFKCLSVQYRRSTYSVATSKACLDRSAGLLWFYHKENLECILVYTWDFVSSAIRSSDSISWSESVKAYIANGSTDRSNCKPWSYLQLLSHRFQTKDSQQNILKAYFPSTGCILIQGPYPLGKS